MRLPQTRREKEIWEACEALWQQYGNFKNLTGDAIRSQLLVLQYKKGSPNEVYRYRKTWQETRGITDSVSVEALTSLAPQTLPDPLNRAVSLVREEIFSEAQQTLEKMTLEFETERTQYQQQYAILQEQLNQAQADNTALQEAQRCLMETQAKTEADKQALATALKYARHDLKNTEKCLSDSQHEQAILLEKIAQTENHLTVLTEASAKELASVKSTLVEQHNIMIQELKAAHHAHVAQCHASEVMLKELMEKQRHHFIQQLDAERTLQKKWQMEKEKIALSLEKTHTERMALQEKAVQYERLIEMHQLQFKQVCHLSATLEKLEKALSVKNISTILTQQMHTLYQQLDTNLQSHFQAQHRWLEMQLKNEVESDASP